MKQRKEGLGVGRLLAKAVAADEGAGQAAAESFAPGAEPLRRDRGASGRGPRCARSPRGAGRPECRVRAASKGTWSVV